MSYDPTDDGSIAEYLKRNGFTIEQTGGGCRAWGKYHTGTGNRFYAWITWADGLNLFPQRDEHDPRSDGGWLVGLYDNETDPNVIHEEWPELTLVAAVREANEYIENPAAWFESTSYLSQELRKFCDEHALPHRSADELAAEVADSDAEAYDWLIKFVERWNIAQGREDALADAEEAARGMASRA